MLKELLYDKSVFSVVKLLALLFPIWILSVIYSNPVNTLHAIIVCFGVYAFLASISVYTYLLLSKVSEEKEFRVWVKASLLALVISTAFSIHI